MGTEQQNWRGGGAADAHEGLPRCRISSSIISPGLSTNTETPKIILMIIINNVKNGTMVLEKENVLYCTAFGCFLDYQHSILLHSTQLYIAAMLATASSVCAVLARGETR